MWRKLWGPTMVIGHISEYVKGFDPEVERVLKESSQSCWSCISSKPCVLGSKYDIVCGSTSSGNEWNVYSMFDNGCLSWYKPRIIEMAA